MVFGVRIHPIADIKVTELITSLKNLFKQNQQSYIQFDNLFHL